MPDEDRERQHIELIRKASARILELQGELQLIRNSGAEPIAIIGMGCRFPQGADTPEKFWELLRSGIDTVTETPNWRWSLDEYYDPDPSAPGKTHVRYGSYLEGIETFDAAFFGISPREAASMDPQQRLLLEVAWEAIEAAGIAPDTLYNTSTGVFVGVCSDDYEWLLAKNSPQANNELYYATGNSLSVAAGRLSYTLGLTGPCLSIDTACSSSLAAVHQACLSLRNRECDAALAGGVNAVLLPEITVTFSKGNMLAPDGRSKTFDASADGYVRGEGCGMVVLKRFSDALASRDNILALIRGTAINHDGRSSGLTAPSGPSQQAVIRQALRNGAVEPGRIGYIEAHGTGTLLGDPIEVGALSAVFGESLKADIHPLWVGSVKTNIGHTEGAAGIAGLIKVVLALGHGEIPPHLHFQKPNPHIDWARSPVRVAATSVPWPADRRLAGVSSFGMSGTNAHVVVEAAPDPPVTTREAWGSEHRILAVSAKTEGALTALAKRYAAFLESADESSLGDICRTAHCGRSHFAHRLAVVGRSAKDLATKLAAAMARPASTPRPKIAFLFGDGGADYGRELYETVPAFRDAVDRYGPSQPFAPQYGLARLWQSWGILPVAVTGQGAGTVVAASVARLLGVGEASPPAGAIVLEIGIAPGQSETQQVLEQLSDLYMRGAAVDWQAVDAGRSRRKVPLPTYAFQRQPYWFEPSQPKKATPALAPLVDRMIRSPLVKETIFETEFSVAALPFLGDHRIFGAVVSPGSCQLAMALTCADLAYGSLRGPVQIEDAVLPQALLVPEKGMRQVQVVFTPAESDAGDAIAGFQLVSFAAGDGESRPSIHAAGSVRRAPAAPPPVDLDEIRARCREPQDVQDFYAAAARLQIGWGPGFQWLAGLWKGPDEALAHLRAPECLGSPAGYRLHPGLLDACFQTSLAAGPAGAPGETRLPFSADALRIYTAAAGASWWCHARQAAPQRWDIRLWDEEGRPVAEVEGFGARAATSDALRGANDDWRSWLYEVSWHEQPLAAAPATRLAGQLWLIFSDAAGIGSALAGLLRERGALPVLVVNGDRFERKADGTFVIDFRSEPDYRQFFLAFPKPRQIVHLSSVGYDGPPESVLLLMQALLRLPDGAPRVCLATCDSQAVLPADTVRGFAQAGVWGMAGTIILEFPELTCKRIDLDAAPPDRSAEELLGELSLAADTDREDQVAFRWGRRYVARLAKARQTPDAREPVELEPVKRGSLDNLAWHPMPRHAPAADEVEVRVHASGLNFRDVLNVLGLYPGDPGQPGLECAGVAAAVGEKVRGIQAGDPVLGLSLGKNGCFGSYALLNAAQVVRKPARLSFEEAATVPVAFLTAQLCLNELARLQPGERVLIHAAAGGVGIAAIQLAHAAGAEVFATASSNKWDALRSLGVRRIYHSRTLDFADGILADTGGEGVHLVLNSLTGPGFIEKSLSTLARNGRFVEIGKRDIWSTEQFQALRPDVQYSVVDLQEWLERRPEIVHDLFVRLIDRFDTGELQPLPQTEFARDRLSEALRIMQHGRHTGKLVITQPTGRTTVRADATYLITGGLGVLGMRVAHWLVSEGAKRLVLMGRRPPAAAVRQQLEEFQRSGVQVVVEQADVADQVQTARMLEGIDPAAPLRGIVHAAGTLADRALLNQSPEALLEVFRPKALGAWNLHQLTKDSPLDFFVLFSSLTGVLGNKGQANYAAANAFLDSLARHRRALRLPALSIAWGPWAEGGMAANLEAEMQSRGLGTITAAQGLEVLAGFMTQSYAPVGVAPIRWPQWLAQFGDRVPAFFGAFWNASAKRSVPPASEALRSGLKTASPQERYRRLVTCIQEEVAQVLRLTQPPLPKQGFADIGLDSLMSVEVRGRLQTLFGIPLAPALLFNYPSVHDLAEHLSRQFAPPSRNGQETMDTGAPVDTAALVDENEMNAMISEELEELSRLF